MKLNDEQRQMVEDNMKLVTYIVKRFKPPIEEWNDYLQVGFYALCLVCLRFDKSREIQFSTYAYPYILGWLRRYRDENEIIRTPRAVKDDYRKIAEYKRLYGEDCDEKEMLKELGISKKRYLNIINATSVVSLEQELFGLEQGSGITFADVIQDSDWEKTIEFHLEENVMINLEKKYIETLPKRHAEIFHDYFMKCIHGDKPSQRELAQIHNTSQGNVSRIVSKCRPGLMKYYNRYLGGDLWHK